METVEEYTQRLLNSDPEFKTEYDRLGPRFEAITALIRARTAQRVSQSELARRMNVAPNTVSRLESGEHSPRIDTLAAAARAMGYEFHVKFVKSKAAASKVSASAADKPRPRAAATARSPRTRR